MEHTSRDQAYGYDIKHRKLSFLSLIFSYKKSLFFGGILLLLTNAIGVFLPRLLNMGVNFVENGYASFNLGSLSFNFTSIIWLCLVIIFAALLGAIARTLSRLVIFDIGRTVERYLREQLFFHVSIEDEQFFLRHPVGDVMNHLTGDISNVRMVAGFATLNIINITLIFCFTLPFLFAINTPLALCALAPFPVVILVIRFITKKMFVTTVDYQAQVSALQSHIQENLLGAHVVRIFHQQEQENRRFFSTNMKTYEKGLILSNTRVLMMPLMRAMMGISVGIILFVGGTAVLRGAITLGDFVEVNARVLQLSWPAMSIGFVMSIISRGKASLQRINGLLQEQPNLIDGKYALSNLKTMVVKDLVVNANIGSNKISFAAKRGQFIGLAGPSGAYKSILLRTLYRRIPVSRGVVFYNDIDINDIALPSLYKSISVVPQESFLFSKSIAENILFSNKNASSEQFSLALSITRLDRDISGFKDGVNTIIGERGITLSGGQRQRVALARALIADRPILILDDALSAVDADTEQHIMNHLLAFKKDHIIIMASHRLAIFQHADLILVMEKGMVKESGTHKILMQQGALYSSLFGSAS